MDRGDWWTPVLRVAKSQAGLKPLSAQIRLDQHLPKVRSQPAPFTRPDVPVHLEGHRLYQGGTCLDPGLGQFSAKQKFCKEAFTPRPAGSDTPGQSLPNLTFPSGQRCESVWGGLERPCLPRNCVTLRLPRWARGAGGILRCYHSERARIAVGGHPARQSFRGGRSKLAALLPPGLEVVVEDVGSSYLRRRQKKIF